MFDIVVFVLEKVISKETLVIVMSASEWIDPLLHWIDNRFPGKFNNKILATAMKIARLMKRYVSPTGLARTVAASRLPVLGNPASKTAQVDDARTYNF
jgi:hypothetical protein